MINSGHKQISFVYNQFGSLVRLFSDKSNLLTNIFLSSSPAHEALDLADYFSPIVHGIDDLLRSDRIYLYHTQIITIVEHAERFEF